MKSEGLCTYCKKIFSGSAMTKHLQGCSDRKKQIEKNETKGRVYLINARCDPFWIYFEVNADSTLEEIDSFLRNLWLECCGHLSLFIIDTTNYSSSPQKGDGDKSMDLLLNKILFVGTSFTHEYDFGTTTTLGLKVVAERNGNVNKTTLVARNNPPDIQCACGKLAKEICSECILDGEEALLCESCKKDHECDEEMFLPVLNSPRTGMCGYTGN